MDISILVGAFVAGVLMFLAPCTLPIVPGYLAFIAGIPLSALSRTNEKKHARRRIMLNALAFTVGFSVLFIALGTTAGTLGSLLGPWRAVLSQLGGIIIMVFGLTMLGILKLPGLSADKHFRLPSFLQLGHPSSSALIGVLFALGWSPCIGPLLGTILLFASTGATALWGATLLAAFSLGLSLPFLLTAALVGESTMVFSRMAGAARMLTLIGGVGLVIVGLIMLTGHLEFFVQAGYRVFEGSGYGSLRGYF